MHNAGSSAALGGRYYKEILLAAAEKLSAVKVFCQGGKQGRGSDRRHTFFTRRKHGQGPAGFYLLRFASFVARQTLCVRIRAELTASAK